MGRACRAAGLVMFSHAEPPAVQLSCYSPGWACRPRYTPRIRIFPLINSPGCLGYRSS